MKKLRRAPAFALLLAGVALALSADRGGEALAQSAPIASPPATNVQDNIAARIDDVRLLRGVPDGTVSCRGNRSGQRPTIRCDVRYVDTIQVAGATVADRDNPAVVWSARTRPYDLADDETAYLLLVDRGDASRAPTVQLATRDLTEIFRQVGPRQRIAVAAFDRNFEVLQDFTNDSAAIAAALSRIRAIGEAGDFFQQALQALRRLEGVQASRKVLLIASDGKANNAAVMRPRLAAEANRLGVRVVAVGYQDRVTDVPNFGELRRLSAETRGFFVQNGGPRQALPSRIRSGFAARLRAGVILEARAPSNDVPRALEVSLRHPRGALTSFTAVLTPGVATPNVNGHDVDTPMTIEDTYLNRVLSFFDDVYAWLLEDVMRAIAAATVIAIVVLGFVVTGIIRRASRKSKPAPAPRPQHQSAPRPAAQAASAAVTPLDPPTVAQPAYQDPPTVARPVFDDPPTVAKPIPPHAPAVPEVAPTVLREPAPATVLREKPAIAWLEFNGEPGTVAMRKERIAIGRETDNDVVTDTAELTVSRHHAVLWLGADGLFQILNRTKEYRADVNPILVNGVAKEAAKLADGDVIKLGTGNYGFLFRDARASSIPGRNK